MNPRERGATLVETAMVIPIIFMVIFGLIEFGHFVTVHSTVTNASREAARYAAGTGVGTGTAPRYADCDGMRDAAKKFGVLGAPNDSGIDLQYDDGSGTIIEDCNPPKNELADPNVISTGDRIVATVTVFYRPWIQVPLVDFLQPRNVSVQTIRTINKG